MRSRVDVAVHPDSAVDRRSASALRSLDGKGQAERRKVQRVPAAPWRAARSVEVPEAGGHDDTYRGATAGGSKPRPSAFRAAFCAGTKCIAKSPCTYRTRAGRSAERRSPPFGDVDPRGDTLCGKGDRDREQWRAERPRPQVHAACDSSQPSLTLAG